MPFAKIGVDVIADGVNKAISDLNKFNKSVKSTTSVGRASATSGNTLSRSLSRLTSIASVASSPITSLGNSIANLGTVMNRVGERAVRLGFRLSATVTAPIIGGFGAAAKAAADFESELTKIETLVGLTAGEVSTINNQLLALAPSVGAMPDELARAEFFATSAGFRDVGASLDIVEKAAQGAAIGLGSVDDVTRAATSVMLAYENQNISTTEALDFLIATTRRGRIEVDELSTALGGSLGTAAELGIRLPEVGASVATMTQTMGGASEAFTSFNRIVVSLAKVTPQAQEALDKAGLSIEGIRATIREDGLNAALVEMREAFDAAGVSAFEFFGRQTAAKGFLILTGNLAGRLRENLDAITNSTGLLQQGFDRVTQTTTFQFNQLKATLATMAIVIGNILLPAINAIVQRIRPLFLAIAQFASLHPQLVLVGTALALVAAAIGPLVLGFGIMVSTIGFVVSAVGTLIAAFGSLLTPIAAIVVALVGGATIIAGSLFFGNLRKQAQETDDLFATLARRAFDWGKNIVIQLARGIAAATIAVVSALAQIGQVIASWLAPGSPPRLLPELPAWGAAAMTEFLHGFTKADFSIFEDVSSITEKFFRSLSSDQFGGEAGLIPAIIGSRDATARAIEEMKQFGSITQATLAAVTGSFGVVSQDIAAYIQTLFQLEAATNKVAAAQERINEIQREFKRITDPINKELGQIAARRQEVVDDLRKKELQQIVDDPRAPQLAKELALLELREIELKNQLRNEEARRDTALEVAEAELAAAEAERKRLQEQAAAQKALIDAQIESNNLLKEQASILERLANAIKDLASSITGIGSIVPAGTLFEGLDELTEKTPQKLQSLFSQISGGADAFALEIERILKQIQKPFEPLLGEGGLFAQMNSAWEDVINNLGNLDQAISNSLPNFETLNERIQTGSGLALELGGGLLAVAGVKMIVTQAFIAIGEAISGVVSALTGTALFAGGVATGGLLFALGLVVALVGANIAKYGSWQAALDAAGETLKTVGKIIEIWVIKKLVDAWTWLETLKSLIDTIVDLTLDNFVSKLKEVGQAIKDEFNAVLGRTIDLIISAKAAWDDFWNSHSPEAAWDDFWNGASPSGASSIDTSNVGAGYISGVQSAIPTPTSAFAATGALAQSSFASGSAPVTTTNNSFAFNTTINSGMDAAEFDVRVQRAVARAIA